MSSNKQSSWRTLGTFYPSTSHLAHAMIKYVFSPKVVNILEVGAGTGAITKVLLANLAPHQQAYILEIFPTLYKMLKSRFGSISNAHIYGEDLLKFSVRMEYDLIISSLPFNSFLPHILERVIAKLITLAKKDALLCFYEYQIIPQITPNFLLPKEFYTSRAIIEQFLQQYKFDEAKVIKNFPPAVVHYLHIKK